MEQIHDFRIYGIVCNPIIVHVPSKQILLLFVQVRSVKDTYLQHIFSFNLKTNKWSENKSLSNLVPIYSAVLTSNHKFVVIIYSVEKSIQSEPHKTGIIHKTKIGALNITNDDDFKLLECSSDVQCASSMYIHDFQCPMHIQRTGGGIKDEMLVNAWINKLFKTSEYNNIAWPPVHITQLICKWYSRELIHIIHCNTYRHYAIELKYILSNMKSKSLFK